MGGKFTKALLLGALVGLPSGVAIAVAYFWPDANLMEPQGFYFGRDFLNYWMGGRLALFGEVEAAYDVSRYNALLRARFSPEQSGMAFSYPPHALPLLALFGALPYLAAYVVWCLLGAIGFVGVALGGRPARDEKALLAAHLLAPIVWVNVIFGQLGLLLAVLFVGALRALPRRPALAGILMGVLTIKPQLGLLLPLALLLAGAWRAIAVAVATALALIALSLALFGLEPWQLYLSQTMPLQWTFVTHMDGFFTNQMVTPYTALWSLGVPVGTALMLQAAFAVVIAATTFMMLRSPASWPLKSAVVAFGSVLMVPYVLAYDLAIPLAALVWYLRDDRPRPEPVSLAIVGALWALPYALTILLQVNGIPLLPLALLTGYAWLVSEALRRGLPRNAQSALSATRA